MGAVDPTYPLYPIATLLASVMLLMVLTTSIVRQNWNLGVAFLCFWLFLENLADGTNAILWSDSADVKLYVYCDIGMLPHPLTLSLHESLIPQQCHICKWRRPSSNRWRPLSSCGGSIRLLVSTPLTYLVLHRYVQHRVCLQDFDG